MDVLTTLLNVDYPCNGVDSRKGNRRMLVCDRLTEIMQNRLKGDNNSPYETVAFGSVKANVDMWNNKSMDSVISTSIEKDCYVSDLTIHNECGIDEWNRESGFTYNIENIAMVGRALCYNDRDIEDVTVEDVREAYEFTYCFDESDMEEENELFGECFDDKCERLLKDLKSAFLTGELPEDNGYLCSIMRDFQCRVIGDIVPMGDVLKNFPYILNFCFGFGEGTDRTVTTFKSDALANYLRIRDSIPDCELKSKMDALKDRFDQVADADYYFSNLTEDTYYVVGFYLRECESNRRLYSPFFHLIFDEIENTYKELCATSNLEVAHAFLLLEFVSFLILYFIP